MSRVPTLLDSFVDWGLLCAETPCLTAKNEPAPTRTKRGPVRAERASIAPPPRVVEAFSSGALGFLERIRDALGILDLGVMAEVVETAQRGGRAELEHGVENPLGRHRIEHSPGERERLGPIPERAVPAIGVPEALLHVANRLVRDRAAPTGADERPLVLRLLVCERMSRREDRSELLAEEALAREPGEERPDGAAEKPLADRRTGGVLNHRAVEEQGARYLHLERARQIARHQLGG